MTDRKLLELAAKAAGIEHVTPSMIEWGQWNPLTDDGDALRLAVTLHIDIDGAVLDFWDASSTDPYATTRRAIVRAAAAIGEQ